MSIKNLFKIAFNALLRNKFRAFLTMLGIIIGVASVIAMLGIGEGSKISIQQQIAGMGLNLVSVVPGSQERGGVQFGSSTMQSLKESDVDAILADCPAVLAATPEVRGNGQVVFGASNWPTSIYGENVSLSSDKGEISWQWQNVYRKRGLDRSKSLSARADSRDKSFW